MWWPVSVIESCTLILLSSSSLAWFLVGTNWMTGQWFLQNFPCFLEKALSVLWGNTHFIPGKWINCVLCLQDTSSMPNTERHNGMKSQLSFSVPGTLAVPPSPTDLSGGCFSFMHTPPLDHLGVVWKEKKVFKYLEPQSFLCGIFGPSLLSLKHKTTQLFACKASHFSLHFSRKEPHSATHLQPIFYFLSRVKGLGLELPPKLSDVPGKQRRPGWAILATSPVRTGTGFLFKLDGCN